ncbi:hypothetical protein MMC22_010602 [Lobaria immixta]|nr:hypothetical protein [Lobaria immixta]
MDDTSFRSGLEYKIQIGHYPFTYNGEMDSAPDPGHSVEDFKFGKFVAVVTILTFAISDLENYRRFTAVEFQVRAQDMPASARFTGIHDYSFQLQSVYLIGLKNPEVSTPKNRKRGPNEWMISPPRTGKSRVGDSPLEWTVPTQSGKKVEHEPDKGNNA